MSLFQLIIDPIREIKPGEKSSGTRLYLRTNAPANGREYTDAENKHSEFLGFVVAVPGVPRWMSSQFAEAVATSEQVNPDASLHLYPEDWMEKIVYVDKNTIPESPDPKDPHVAAANNMITVNQPAQHLLAYGCNQASPRTLIHPIKDNKPSQTADPTPYYAIVSKVDPNDPAKAFEITIATIGNRPNFTKSDFHRSVLKRCLDLRLKQPTFHSLAKKRADTLNAIANSRFQP